MISNWMIPRNKRKLTSIVDALLVFSISTVGAEWGGDVQKQRQFEALLEKQKLKRSGDRRDMRAGGARTYESQLSALGLIFKQENHGNKMQLTLAGEALINGEPPVPILQKQLMLFQYPSEYSRRRNVGISAKYRVHPFRFILKLLLDPAINTLSEQEVARFAVVYGYKDTDLHSVKQMILNYREIGNESWIEDEQEFLEITEGSRTRHHTLDQRLKYLEEIANTFFNYLESAQLVEKTRRESSIKINKDAFENISSYLEDDNSVSFIRDADRHEVFQRRYGLDLVKTKDTRSFGAGQVTDYELQERFVMRAYLDIAAARPIFELTNEIIESISDTTGVSNDRVKSILLPKVPKALDTFEAGYWDMAHQGRDHANDFEVSTMYIFQDVFKYYAEHVGQQRPGDRRGGNPDVFVVSLTDKYSGIIDTKAYSAYGLENDHRNRMKSDYIPDFKLRNVNGEDVDLSFFMYIAGGFDNGFDDKLADLASDTGIDGSAISASNMIRLLRRHSENKLTHSDLQDLFSVNRELLPADFGI